MRDELVELEPMTAESDAVDSELQPGSRRRAIPWYRIVIVVLLGLIAVQQYQFKQYLDRDECVTTAYLEQSTNRLQSWRSEVAKRCGLAPVLPPGDATAQQQ